MDKISFDDFKKVELKVGTIVEVDRVEGADKLYKLQVDVGEEEPRQIVTGLVDYYTAEELQGKKIVVVTNLKPAKFRGVESNGMLLASAGDDDSFALLTPEKDVPSGSPIS